MAIEYGSTMYLVVKTSFLIGSIIGKTWVMYKNLNTGKKLVEKSSPLYQIYTNYRFK